MVYLASMRQDGCVDATKRVVDCDEAGEALRQNGCTQEEHCDKTGAPQEHCDKTGGGSLFTNTRVAKGQKPP